MDFDKKFWEKFSESCIEKIARSMFEEKNQFWEAIFREFIDRMKSLSYLALLSC